MEKSVVALALAGVLGGLVGSGVTIGITGRFSPRPNGRSAEKADKDHRPGPPETPARATVEPDATAKRVALLERRVRLLTTALAQRAENGGSGSSTRDVDVADPVFEVAVMDIIDRVEAEKEDERDERRSEMRKQFSDRMSQRLEASLGLTAEQKRKLSAVINEHFDAIRAIREAEDRPVTRAEWRERIDDVTVRSEQKLEEFLSPTQLSSYRELEEDERLGGGWGGRRRER